MSLPAALLLMAAFAQVILTLWAIVAMGRARIAAIEAQEVTVGEIVLDDRAWPDRVKQLQANVRNQFETPVLLFAGIAIALGIGAANWGTVIFAGAYIGSRIAHRAVHVGTNRIGDRFRAYVIGLAALAGLWASLIVGAFLL